LSTHPYLQVSDAPERHPDPSAGVDEHDEERLLRRIFRRLLATHGVDFSQYKRSTLRRRLRRRQTVQKMDDLSEYAALVEQDSDEAATLYKDFLIRVTEFFRDPASFDALRQKVFPELCADRSPKNPIRVWVPGCSTGEEVYSLAICLLEHLGDQLVPGSIQFFGTDVSEAAIDHARAGIYLDATVHDISPQRLQRFFVEQDGRHKIAKSVRDLCIFARQDVTRDPPFSQLDLISCKNLLIYLETPAQRRVMEVFHYALKSSGTLLLGPSETVGQADDLFALTDKQNRLYQRTASSRPIDLDLRTASVSRFQRARADAGPLDESSVQREADRLLLARYAPASVLIGEDLNILQFRGETGPYLEHASGAPSFSLHRVLRTELLAEVSAAIREAHDTGAETGREGLTVDDRRDIKVSVIPLQNPNSARNYLVLFEDGSRPMSGRRVHAQPPPPLEESEKDRRLAHADRELAALRSYLQATVEDHEAVKEELKSAHEEVLSANEEFQSTNEELETSKEELQSANEELTTTNEELRSRNRELATLNAVVQRAEAASARDRAYSDAVIQAVGVPLVVLEADLKIIRVNDAFYDEFRVGPEDTLGKLLYDIGNGQWNDPALRRQLDAVLSKNEPMSEIEIEHHFPRVGYRSISLTARRIVADAERPDLILLALENITDRQVTANTLRERSRRKDEFLAMLAHELRNPLMPITNAVQILRRIASDPASVKLFDIISRQTAQLAHLVNELLDVARIGRGLIELQRQNLDLVALVNHAAEASRPRIEQRGQTFSVELPDDSIAVNADPVRLQQAIANLLDNATKYTEPGGQVALAVRQESTQAVVTVRDDGIGIDPSRLEEIFELFSQVDTSLARSGGGLGIGLTVVRRVLEMHGGSIEARSAGLGRGSEFVVRLPVASFVDAQPDETGAAIDSAPNLAGRRVLIVDDNADLAETLAQIVVGWGHEVAIAGDGPSALELVRNFQPDAALIDIGLPGVTGYEIARRIRADVFDRDLHLVAITGYGRPEDRDAARAAGFDAHMTKPVALNRLREMLERKLAPGGRPSATDRSNASAE